MATMNNPELIKNFVGAGKATLTLQSAATNAHYTYRVVKKDEKPPFVFLLTGGDQDFTYLGMIGRNGFCLTNKSRLTDAAPSVKAFKYFYNNVIVAGKIPAQLKVMHEGKCGCCGRPLTHPESIDTGLGPICAARLH